MTNRGWLVAAAIVLLAHPAGAQLRAPDCASLADWAQTADRAARWSPNAIGSRISLAAAFLAPEAERLFGKPVLAWTAEDARSVVAVFDACRQEWQRARRQDAMAAAQPFRNEAVGPIPRYLAARAQAKEAARQAAEAIGAAEPSLPLLAFVHGLGAAGSSAEGYTAAGRSAQQIQGPANGPARSFVTALRDLPTAEIEAAIAPLTVRLEALRAGVARALEAEIAAVPTSPQTPTLLARFSATAGNHRAALGDTAFAAMERAIADRRDRAGNEIAEGIGREIAAMPANVQGMQMLDRMAGTLRQREGELGPQRLATLSATIAERRRAIGAEVARGLERDIATISADLPGLAMLDRLAGRPPGLFDAEQSRAIDAAIGARRTAIREEISAALIAEIGHTPADETGFARLDQMTDRRLLAQLTPEQQTAVTAAATARRTAVADALFVPFQRQLAALPASEASLDVIDHEVIGGMRAWPASAAPFVARFQEAATARRAELVTRLNRAEAGSLRGRIYEGDGVAFEFVDRTRVFVKSPLGQTLAGTYAEERDGRVVVTLNNESLVLAREGKRLVGGPTLLTRTK
jgi:hypothetical protein